MIHANDLPVAWDGQPVQWGVWELMWTTAVFHFKPVGCEKCGNTDELGQNAGCVEEQIGPNRYTWVTRLFAFRCPGCRLDTVWDMRTGETWTLDETDYGRKGSLETQGALF